MLFRKAIEVLERCKGKGWSCPRLDLDNVDSD